MFGKYCNWENFYNVGRYVSKVIMFFLVLFVNFIQCICLVYLLNTVREYNVNHPDGIDLFLVYVITLLISQEYFEELKKRLDEIDEVVDDRIKKIHEKKNEKNITPLEHPLI
jgi:hypothetical protein